MSHYEAEQKKLQKLYNEILSEEESSRSEFSDVHLSDSYSPSCSESDSDDSSSVSDFAKKKRLKLGYSKRKQPIKDDYASTSKQESAESNNEMDIFDQVIEDVILQYTVDSADSGQENIEEENSAQNFSNLQWRPVDGSSLKQFSFVAKDIGIDAKLYEIFYNKSPIDIFKLFLTDELLSHIVVETNRYAQQSLTAQNKLKSRIKKWIPTNNSEIEKFLGFLLWMGLVRHPSLKSYWQKSPLYSNNVSKILSRNRFELLLSNLHFSDNNDVSLENDRLRKITPLIDQLVERFQIIYTPGSKLCIDETMVPFRGRLRFKQFIKNKRHKFGIKVYKLCCEGGYTYNLKVYCGADSAQGGQASANVVSSLMQGLFNTGRKLYTDNYYTSVSLASELLTKKTHLIGTLRSNRKYNPQEVVQKKLKPKDVVAQESDTGIVVLKWRDKREVLMLTTVHTDEQKKVKQRGGETEKPEAVLDYNQAKSFIDLSDQIKSYSHCLRRSTKWYRKLAVELLLGTAVVNAHIVYKEVTQEKISITEFREKLCLSLLGLTETQLATDQASDEETDEHYLVESESRLRCVVCYRKLKMEFGRKISLNKTSRSKWKCSVCCKFYCITCFFEDHYVNKK